LYICKETSYLGTYIGAKLVVRNRALTFQKFGRAVGVRAVLVGRRRDRDRRRRDRQALDLPHLSTYLRDGNDNPGCQIFFGPNIPKREKYPK
jgi:hypothetical protein